MGHELRSKPGHLVWRAYQLTWQIFAEEAGPLDITPVQEALLLILSRRENLDQKTLAELVALDRSTAGNVIDRLEKRKLIARVENDKDRRARLVSLTSRGKSLSEKLRPIAQRAAERLLRPLSPLERSEFIRLLRKVTGLADPFDQSSTTPPKATKLIGKQILCVGLSDAFGETIVQRLQLDGAQVIELPIPDLEMPTRSRFEESLKKIVENNDGIDTLVNGGNLQADFAQIEPDWAYSRIHTLTTARWLTLECLLPHFLDKRYGRVINLGLFPPAGVMDRHHAATAVANSSIVYLSKQIAADYRHHGIISNSISPRLEHISIGLPTAEQQKSKLVDVSAIDAALAVVYLASDEARSVSASNIILG
jgi:DNA-binding MarR family transcriptional regulator